MERISRISLRPCPTARHSPSPYGLAVKVIALLFAPVRIRSRHETPSVIRESHFLLSISKILIKKPKLRGRRPDPDLKRMDPISHKYTGRPFPFRKSRRLHRIDH